MNKTLNIIVIAIICSFCISCNGHTSIFLIKVVKDVFDLSSHLIFLLSLQEIQKEHIIYR